MSDTVKELTIYYTRKYEIENLESEVILRDVSSYKVEGDFYVVTYSSGSRILAVKVEDIRHVLVIR